MRKLGIIFLTLTVLFLSVGILLQTDWAKSKVENLFVQMAASEGIQFETESIEGTIPFTIAFTNLSLKSSGFDLKIEKLKARLSLFALFQRFIQIPYLEAEGISLVLHEEDSAKTLSPPPFRLEIEELKLSKVHINESIQTDFTGKATLSKKGVFALKGTAHPTSPSIRFEPIQLASKIDLTKMVIQSKFSGKVDDLAFSLLVKKKGSQNWEIKKSAFKYNTFSAIAKGSIDNLQIAIKETTHSFLGKFKLQTTNLSPFQGDIQGRWNHFDLPWNFNSNFSWNPQEPLELSSIKLQSPSLSLTGDITITPEKLIKGHSDLSVRNIHPLLPSFYGTLSSSIDWEIEDHLQRISQITEGINLYYGDLFIQSARLEGSILDPLGSHQGNLFFQGSDLKWKELFLPSIQIQTVAANPQDYSFALSTFGKWKHPLDLRLSGQIHNEPETFSCTLQHGAGSFFTHPFSLSEPASIEITPHEWHLKPLQVELEEGTLNCSLDRTPEMAQAFFQLKQFPLDLLSLNPLDIEVQGTIDLGLNFNETAEKTTGNLDLSLTNFTRTKVSGVLQGTFKDEICSLKASIHKPSSPLLESQISFPCHLSLRSLDGKLLNEAMKGTLFFQGQMDPLLDLVDLGFHRFEGDLVANLNITGTPLHPLLQGTMQLTHGYYENYFTGTELMNVQGLIQAHENRLILKKFSGSDGKKGEIQATGELLLHPKDLFPFSINASLKRFLSLQIDLVTAETEGTIHISGNQKGANIEGTIEVVESDLNIPNKIARLLPDLQITYKNPIKPAQLPSLENNYFYPLHLNLKVIAPDSIFIDGRGLLSEWKGDFSIHGTYDAPAMEGNVSLIQGNFSFSGRKFKLTDGSLTFSGTPNQMPQIDLSGVMDVSDLSILAKLKGPLNNPQILLQSVPPLPLSSIMSYLLFGRDLAEINSFQALELASSLASIAGEGPEILEKTRKALGVDRIEIVTQPNGCDADELEQTIALQVGKYVSEGVFVSFTQGAEDASGNIGIEVDLKHGFVLELESDQRQQQGKFTLKWARSY
jgi:autotransporter translocation and assembly factor TamB